MYAEGSGVNSSLIISFLLNRFRTGTAGKVLKHPRGRREETFFAVFQKEHIISSFMLGDEDLF